MLYNVLTKAPGEQLMPAGRLAVGGFWDMWPAFWARLSVH